jgi:ABC-type multidrug transport system fused ATPase/permease subunit
VGIVGPSGGGKSTLVQVLLGLRSPQRGDYLVNGRPAADHDLATWFGQFVLVPQDNRLLRGTIADNIRFHRPHLDDDAVEQAARAAHLHDDVVALPEGYRTPVGAGATDLSGGQRQRLGLARALAGRPSVLVLDEPTSALDMRSEALVQETLEDLRGRLTMFIVAHRVTTLGRCDRIMVLRGGAIEDFDAPDELLRSNDFFREVHRLSALR